MKKLCLSIALILTLSLLLCSAASADTITAIASEINPEHLEKTASYARILGYNEDSNMLAVELIVPETFDGEDILNLKPGDSIFTDGREIVIQEIERNDEYGYVMINPGDAYPSGDFVTLHEDPYSYDGNYMPERYGRYTWISLVVIDCPVKDTLLFLDYIDEEATGDALRLPIVYTAEELKAKLLKEQAADDYFIGLANDNIYVVFDGEGNLSTIQRYFVSWQ